MHRGLRITFIFLGGLFILLVIAGAGYQYVNVQPWFCNSCHEMNFHYNSWQNSTHDPEAVCTDCHAEPGVRGYIEEKVRGAEQVVAHFSGNYTLPIKIILRVKNDQCLACHPEAPILPNQTTQAEHALHFVKNVLCADCHSRLVHAQPGQPKVIQTYQCDSCHKSHPASLLTGIHANLSCNRCHTSGKYKGHDPHCESCHPAPAQHVAGINRECGQCHLPSGWKPAKFDHSAFALTGNHQGLECAKCHPNGSFQGTSPICESCHSAPSNHLAGITTNCAQCHAPDGWLPAKFNHSSFPLTGNHQGVACEKCHPNSRYQGTSPACETCHQVPVNHLAGISSGCVQCHTPQGWTPANIDHSKFALDGGHQGVACTKCHLNGQFQGTSPACESCHQIPANHITGITTGCAQCHTPAGWKPAQFDHSNFKLTGVHKLLACNSCHSSGGFQGTSTLCAGCHNPPATHQGMPGDCTQCHTTSGFSPAIFQHQQVGEHVPAGEVPLQCAACHTNRYVDYSCMGGGCHSSNNPGGD